MTEQIISDEQFAEKYAKILEIMGPNIERYFAGKILLTLSESHAKLGSPELGILIEKITINHFKKPTTGNQK